MPGKVRVIPANTNEPMKHVVIYACVSSNTMDQLESLKAQVSGLTKFISGHNNWKLVDIHIDIASAKKDSFRPAFHQMIEECKAGLTDILVVKSISRLGRDTVEVLDEVLSSPSSSALFNLCTKNLTNDFPSLFQHSSSSRLIRRRSLSSTALGISTSN